jgi:hypothetical protein
MFRDRRPAGPARTSTDAFMPSFSRTAYLSVYLEVVCHKSYKEYIAHKFFNEICSLLNFEENLLILGRDYLMNKYRSSIRSIISRYDDMGQVDKVSQAVEKSEQIIKTGEAIILKTIGKGDAIEVALEGGRGYDPGAEEQGDHLQ